MNEQHVTKGSLSSTESSVVIHRRSFDTSYFIQIDFSVASLFVLKWNVKNHRCKSMRLYVWVKKLDILDKLNHYLFLYNNFGHPLKFYLE